MATMTLSIRELESCVREKARPKTVSVVEYSKAQGGGFITVWTIATLTLGLKYIIGALARRQDKLITRLVQIDFNSYDPKVLGEMAIAMDELVAGERELLDKTAALGYELRAFWPLETLEQQVERLDSISESLHLASDPECVALLSLAVEQVALK